MAPGLSRQEPFHSVAGIETSASDADDRFTGFQFRPEFTDTRWRSDGWEIALSVVAEFRACRFQPQIGGQRRIEYDRSAAGVE